MKNMKLSFDFSDDPKIVELLRMQSAKSGKTQKAIVLEALRIYLSDTQEEAFIMSAAEKSFASWINPDDEVYDSI